MKNDLIAPSYQPAETMSAGMQQHLRTGHLSVLKHAKTALTLENHTVESVYSVYDAHKRKMGVVFSARYADEKRVSWFASNNNGEVSIHLLEKRIDALQVLEVMFAAELLSGNRCMSKAKSPLLRD